MRVLINLAGIMGHDSQEICARDLLRELLPLLKKDTVVVVSSRFFNWEGIDTSSVRRICLPGLGSRLGALFTIEILLPLLSLFLRSERIYAPTPFYPHILRKKSYPTVHDLAYTHEGEGGLFACMYMNHLYKNLRYVKKVFTVSSSIQQEVIETFALSPHDVVVAKNALPTPSSQEVCTREVPRAPYFVYVGISRPRKNLEYLITAFSLFYKTHPDYRLIFVGSVAKDKTHLYALAREGGCEDALIFTGFVSSSCKDTYIRESRALIFPSLYEGFGLPLLEAQHVGAVVAASDISIFHEIGGDTLLYSDPKDPQALCATLLRIADALFPRETYIHKGRDNVARFSWKDSAEIIYHTLTS